MSRVSPNDPRPPYVQIADDLRTAIRSGQLKPRQKISSGRDLAERYGVSHMTVHHALSVLRDEGMVTSWQGRGVFVRDPDAEQPAVEATGIPEPYDAITRRLDEMNENIRRIDDRLARLESLTRPEAGSPENQPVDA